MVVCRFRASDFCALGRLQILSGLKTNFRCLRRSVVPHHRQCKGKKLSLRFTNLRTKIFRAATPVTVLQFEIMLYECQQLTLYLYIYLYIYKYRSILGYGKGFSRTVTLKRCNSCNGKFIIHLDACLHM
jgi:hypothetical protein